MYENYSRQALPTKHYRELLGSSVCVFNSNNAFMIENILRCDSTNEYNWYQLIDCESGKLKPIIETTIEKKCGIEIGQLFSKLVGMRNRIIHSFRITNGAGEQVLATKTKVKDGNKQFEITEKYMLEFIQLNEELSNMLHDLRGY